MGMAKSQRALKGGSLIRYASLEAETRCLFITATIAVFACHVKSPEQFSLHRMCNLCNNKIMTQAEKIEAFQASCRMYRKEKDRVHILETMDRLPSDDIILDYMHEDIHFVEKYMEKFRKLCGPNSKVMIWLLYVEGERQVDVARRYGLSRRQLQYSLQKWFDRVFPREEGE
jgi:hypothetical protein